MYCLELAWHLIFHGERRKCGVYEKCGEGNSCLFAATAHWVRAVTSPLACRLAQGIESGLGEGFSFRRLTPTVSPSLPVPSVPKPFQKPIHCWRDRREWARARFVSFLPSLYYYYVSQMDMRDFKLNTGVLTEGEESDDEGTTDGSSSLSFNDTQEVTVPISLCLTIMVG